MNAGIAAYVILSQNTDVTDIVGVNIFPEVAEQETATPFIVYQLLSVAPEDTHDGPSTLDEVRFEFLCYADSYALAADLGSKVRGALDRVSGTYNGVNVESIQFNDVDIDTIDAPRRFAQVLTFTFRIKRDNVEIAQGTPVTGAKLGDLYDVDTTGVTDGQVIAYDAAAQEWQPADDAGGVTQLGQLTDVQFGQGGPEIGELLKYDGSEWTNDGLVKSEIGLGNVDNTSDANKPVSTATQTELNAKANSADFSNVDNTSDADKPVSTATQTALNAKADTSAVPTDLNDLSDVSIVGTPAGNQALIYDATAGAFKSQVSYTNRFEDEVEQGLYIPTIYAERGYSVKSEGDGIFIDPSSDTPTAGKVIKRKIYHKTGFITDADVIGDYTLIHTFADDTAYADTVAVFDAFEEGATYGVPPFTLFQTWEEVTAAPAFTGLLNETYGSGAEAAYSTRRLNGLYSGDCMTIRRASDSTTQSIGFVGEEIDESAIETFCSGTTCTIQVWFDQSGNGNNATQTDATKQPTIYTGGQLVKEGGRLALDFDGSNDHLNFTQIDLTSDCLIAHIATHSAADSAYGGPSGNFGAYQNTTTQLRWRFSGATYYATVPTITAGDQYLSLFRRESGTANMSYDGADTTSQSLSGTGSFSVLGASTQTAHNLLGKAQEYIFYTSAKTSQNRTDIEGNISDYFQSAKLLDHQYGEGAEAAYSTRQLRRDQTDCMVIRRASDSTTTTIGFDTEGNISEADIETFCTGTSCTVSEWKDQSGNGNDATAAAPANEPTIYTGNALVKENGKVAVYFDGSNDSLKYAGNFFGGSAATGFSVSSFDNATRAAREIIYGLQDTTGARYDFLLTRQSSAAPVGTTANGIDFYVEGDFEQGLHTITDVNQHLLTSVYSDTVKRDIFDNGVAAHSYSDYNLGTLTDGTDFVIGEDINGGNGIDGNIQEIVIYNSDKSTDRTSIEENIGDYFTQNTPLLDTYSGAAAAYSLRRLSSTYTGDAVEVYNGSSYANVGFNVFGELDTVALAAHCGSNDGFVSKWYSQTGSNDATQTVTGSMPKIYDGTTGVVTENGKPAVQFDGSDDVLNGSSINPTNDLTMLVVYNCSSSNTFNTLFGQGRGFIGSGEANTDFSYGLNGNNVEPDVQNTNLTGVIGLSASTSRNKQELGELYYSRNANAYVYVDGSLGDSSTTPDYPIRNAHSLSIGAAGFTPNARIQEAIVYNSDQNAAGNRAGIETNINTFYNIYS